MSRIVSYLALFTLTLAPCHTVLAQRFEGVIRQRTITVDEAALQDLLFGDADEADVPDETEEAYMRRMAKRLFEIPLERVRAAATEGGETEEATIHVKGGRLRVGVGSAGGPISWMVMDVDAGTFTMVSEAERYFVRLTREELAGQLQALGTPTGDPDPEGAAPDVRALSQTAMIAGQRCRGFEVAMEEGQLAWGWVTDAYPGLQATLRAYGERAAMLFGDEEDEGPAIEDLLLERGFPMRVQRVYGGFGSFSSYEVEEVLSIEQTPIPDAMFDVPAGFTQKSIKDLWGQ